LFSIISKIYKGKLELSKLKFCGNIDVFGIESKISYWNCLEIASSKPKFSMLIDTKR